MLLLKTSHDLLLIYHLLDKILQLFGRIDHVYDSRHDGFHIIMQIRPGSDAVLFMSRTQFEFGPTQIDKSTPLDSDAVLFGRS